MERKEAIEIIKKNWPDSSFTMLREALETLIPELTESEDEKIRKRLLEYFKSFTSETFFNGVPTNDAIAWLEKQGEQNYKIIKGKNYFCVKTHNYAGVEWIRGTKYYASDNYTLVNQGCEYYCPEYSKEEHNNLFEEVKCDCYNEKQREQKPDDKIEPKFKVGQTIIYKGTEKIAPTKMTISDIAKGQYWDNNCCIVPISDQDNWELVGQKPAWSEEDEERFESCIRVLQTSDGYDTINAKWFKSLKNRYTWRPSNGQMASVTCAVRKMKESACYDSELVHLLQDLEKLRGE